MKKIKEKTELSKQIDDFIVMTISGRERTTNKQLSEMILKRFNLKFGGAMIRDLIHKLRCENYLIVADSRGYYIAETPEEVRDYLKSLDGRARSIAIVANSMRQAMKSNFYKPFLTK